MQNWATVSTYRWISSFIRRNREQRGQAAMQRPRFGPRTSNEAVMMVMASYLRGDVWDTDVACPRRRGRRVPGKRLEWVWVVREVRNSTRRFFKLWKVQGYRRSQVPEAYLGSAHRRTTAIVNGFRHRRRSRGSARVALCVATLYSRSGGQAW